MGAKDGCRLRGRGMNARRPENMMFSICAQKNTWICFFLQKIKQNLDLFTKSYSTRTIPVRSPYAAVTSIFKNVSKTNAFSTNSTRTQPVRTRTLARANPYDSRTLPVRLKHAINQLFFNKKQSRRVPCPYENRTQPVRNPWFF